MRPIRLVRIKAPLLGAKRRKLIWTDGIYNVKQMIIMKILEASAKLFVRLDRFFGKYKAIGHGVRLGENVKISWRARYLEYLKGEITIGDNSVVHPWAILAPYQGGKIRIGNYSSINPYCIIYGHGGTTIGDRVRIAAHTTIIPANHDFRLTCNSEFKDYGLTREGISIGDDVWIGANVTILDGVSICSCSIIGAGSVVTKSITKPGIYAGSPAKFIKPINGEPCE